MNTSFPTLPGILCMKNTALISLTLACAAALFLQAEEPKKAGETYPKVVLILRHAEKPPDEDKSVHLSDQGKKRAQALPQLFAATATRPRTFPTPDFIFATHNTLKSHRPVETVTPLAKKLGLPIDDSFRNKEEAKDDGKGMTELARELFSNKKYQGKTILVCWHHGTLPELAKLLRATRTPEEWKKDRFDRVWEITYDEKGKTTFRDRPQRLLPGDSEK